MLDMAHRGYSRGQGQLVSLSRLQVLLAITAELLTWQVKNGQAVDTPYLKGTFGLAGDDLPAELAVFREKLTPDITQGYAEQLLRPLASRAFDLNAVPDAVLGAVFTRTRLQAIFPLCMYSRNWDFNTLRHFMDEVRPVVPAVRETIEAGTLKLEIRISGQEPGTRPGGWYDTPQLFLVLEGQDFLMPSGHAEFSELLRTLTVWHTHPAALGRAWHGQHVMFSTRETASNEVILGVGALRVFLPEAGFAELAAVLESLNCLYGDL